MKNKKAEFDSVEVICILLISALLALSFIGFEETRSRDVCDDTNQKVITDIFRVDGKYYVDLNGEEIFVHEDRIKPLKLRNHSYACCYDSTFSDWLDSCSLFLEKVEVKINEE